MGIITKISVAAAGIGVAAVAGYFAFFYDFSPTKPFTKIDVVMNITWYSDAIKGAIEEVSGRGKASFSLFFDKPYTECLKQQCFLKSYTSQGQITKYTWPITADGCTITPVAGDLEKTIKIVLDPEKTFTQNYSDLDKSGESIEKSELIINGDLNTWYNQSINFNVACGPINQTISDSQAFDRTFGGIFNTKNDFVIGLDLLNQQKSGTIEGKLINYFGQTHYAKINWQITKIENVDSLE